MSTRAELALAAATLAITGSLVAALPRSGFVLFLAIGGLLQAGRYLASPLVALIAEHDLRRQTTYRAQHSDATNAPRRQAAAA